MKKRYLATKSLALIAAMLMHGCGAKDAAKNDASGETEEASSEDKIKTDLTYFNFAKPLFEKYCVSCHSVPAVRGAPGTFRLDTYGNKDGYPGVKAMLAQIKSSIENGTMPVDDSLTKSENEKIIEWLSAGAPEGTGEDTVKVEKEPVVSILEPIFEGSAPDAGNFDIIVSFQNIQAEQGWSVFYTTEQGATANGTAIATNIPLDTTIYTWDTTAIPDGTYFIYVRVLTNDGILRKASNGSITIDNTP